MWGKLRLKTGGLQIVGYVLEDTYFVKYTACFTEQLEQGNDS